MAVTIVDGNLYLTNGSVSGNTINTSGSQIVVGIHSSKIEYDLTNELKIRPLPVSKGNTGTQPDSLIVDLKIITETIQATGFLEDEANESATVKRNNLLALAQLNRELTVVWNTGNYQTLIRPTFGLLHGVFVNKIKFTETAGKVGDADVTNDPAPERMIEVQLQLVRGKDI